MTENQAICRFAAIVQTGDERASWEHTVNASLVRRAPRRPHSGRGLSPLPDARRPSTPSAPRNSIRLVHYQAPRRLKASVGSQEPGFTVSAVGSVLLMGSSFVVGKILLDDGFPPLLLVGWRFLLAALVALPLFLILSRAPLSDYIPSRAGLRNYATIAGIGLIQTTAAMGLLYLAMRRVSATTAAVLMFTNPVWVVTERFILNEPVLQGRVLALTLRIAGVVLAIMVGRDAFSSSSALYGYLIAMAAACCWAAATILQRRARLSMETWALNLWQMLVGAMALLAIAYLSGEHWPSRMTDLQVACFLWLAIPASAVAYGVWLFAVKNAGGTHAGGFLSFVPLVAAVLSYFFLNVGLTGWQALGGVLTGMAVWLDSRSTPPEFVPPP